MEHLLPLPDDIIQRLIDHCIPFREEFYECRIDNGERHDPITLPHGQLTYNAVRMLYSNSACRQWQLIEGLLGNLIRAGRNPTLNPDLVRDPMVLRPRAMGKSFNTDALVSALIAIAATPPGPIPRPTPDHEFVMGDIKVGLRVPKLSDFLGNHLRQENFHRPWTYCPPREYYDPPANPNTTDYPLPRGGKRIPKHGEKQCGPSRVLLALIARSQ